MLGLNVHVLSRSEWESKLRPGGEPTRLPGPLSPFSRVGQEAQIETYAMSARPFAQPGGFHIVRREDRDAPNIFNTDSYIELNLTTMSEWPRILSAAGIQGTAQLDRLLSEHVFLSGPERRPDHHSAQVPPDIEGADTK